MAFPSEIVARPTSAKAAVKRPRKTITPEADFKRRLGQVARSTEILLDRLLASSAAPGEVARPQRLLKAMRYSGLGGGKRIRPFLVVATSELFAVPRRQALMVAAALECIHCYSLVHDDLPAMDNDGLRRGRATTHVAFDEATAILAGDGLLTFAFDVMSRPQVHPDAKVRIELVSALARASGVGGMAGGQMLDLAAEGRFSSEVKHNADDVKLIQTMKTGALLKFACVSGAILGGADHKSQSALERYGAAIGEAFQVADDLLDVEGDSATVGKATGKDAAAHKATFVSLRGVDGARATLNRLVEEAEGVIAVFGKDSNLLKAAARFIASRQN
jgi:farnesyl diphosphate synthase